MRTYATNLSPFLGARLRQLRKAKGWSIQQLSEAVGSSASAVHRYESGWDRFELRTLRRLAAALGARVEIDLVPIHDSIPARDHDAGELVTLLRPLFWDVELDTAHLVENPQWVLRRVLMEGDWEQVHRARLHYGNDAVREASRHRSVDRRTRRLWEVVLGGAEPLR